jgi:hypothetical protein
MAEVARTADAMIAGMAPDLRAGEFVFITTRDDALVKALAADALSSFREEEGVSLILPLAIAQEQGLCADQPMRLITLKVYSALDGVGLTAAVSGALARGGIACNMVAAYHHDHVFVPSAMSERAIEILTGLRASMADRT